jgi:cysteine desulfuration protein SufE
MSIPKLEDLQENFALFDDWEDRYRYLIDLGKHLPVMDEALKTEQTIVKGCISRVWMVCETGDGGAIHFTADSDAHIVRGLIALVLVAYQDKTPAQIGEIDIEATFKEIGLDQHLSPNRRNGFFAMVERVRALAGN